MCALFISIKVSRTPIPILFTEFANSVAAVLVFSRVVFATPETSCNSLTTLVEKSCISVSNLLVNPDNSLAISRTDCVVSVVELLNVSIALCNSRDCFFIDVSARRMFAATTFAVDVIVST